MKQNILKFNLIMLLTLLGGSIFTADTASEQTAEESAPVTLLSCYEQPIVVPEERAILSVTVKNFIDDVGAEELVVGIPLGSKHCTLAVLETLFGNDGYVEKLRNNELTLEDLPDELKDLAPLLLAVNFLDIVIDEQPDQRTLLDTICAKIANTLTPEMLENEETLAALATILNEIPNELQVEIAAQLLASKDGQCALGSALCKTVQHGNWVNSVAFSHDGTYIATASHDNTARVYDLENPAKPILTVQHGGYVNSVAFSQDGTYIATGSDDNTARVYHLKRPTEPILTVQHGGCVSCVAFSPCGRYIATASDDNTARVYDLKRPTEPILTVQHGDWVLSVAFSHDGTYIATASLDHTARVYDLKSPAKPILTVQHGGLVRSVAFSHDGTYIATASWDKTAQIHLLPPPNSAFKYLTILQALFILLAEQKADAHQTIVPSEKMQQMWSLFHAEEKCFLQTKLGASSLQEISESMHHAATCIQKQQQENNRLSPLFSPLRLLALLDQIIGGDVENPLEVMDNGFENIGLDTLEEYDN